jgi:hypothetical protein
LSCAPTCVEVHASAPTIAIAAKPFIQFIERSS